MVVGGKDRETLQMGMKTQNIWFKTPKIHNQNPNKFSGEKVQKLPGGAQNGGRQWKRFAKQWWRDETIRVSAFRVEITQKLTSEHMGQTLLNVGHRGSDVT